MLRQRQTIFSAITSLNFFRNTTDCRFGVHVNSKATDSSPVGACQARAVAQQVSLASERLAIRLHESFSVHFVGSGSGD